MAADVLGIELALVDAGLDERVVLGDLAQLAVAQDVAAGIADVAEGDLVLAEEHGGQGAAHAIQVWVLVDVRGDVLVALVRGRGQQVFQLIAVVGLVDQWGIQGAEGINEELGGNLAGSVATHAVGQSQQTRAGVGGVFVVAADQATVRARRVVQRAPDASVLALGHASILTWVWPMRISIPAESLTG